MKKEIISLIEAKFKADTAFFQMVTALLAEEKNTKAQKKKRPKNEPEEEQEEEQEEVSENELQILQRIKENLR